MSQRRIYGLDADQDNGDIWPMDALTILLTIFIALVASLMSYYMGYNAGQDFGFTLGKQAGELEERSRNIRPTHDITDIFLN